MDDANATSLPAAAASCHGRPGRAVAACMALPEHSRDGRGTSENADAANGPAPPASRIVMIGASNLTRCLSTVVGLAQGLVPGPHDLFIACGHGRSYGVRSSVLFRSLPGVLECGLWDDLQRRAPEHPAPMHALVTDIGNDILYGYDAPTLVDWVTRTIDRLTAYEPRLIVTALPAFNIDRLSPLAFRFFRRLFCPTSTLTLVQAQQRTHAVNDALRRLTDERGFALVDPQPAWYALDPIHYRRRCWQAAWQTMLAPWRAGEAAPEMPQEMPPAPSPHRRLRLRMSHPQRRWWFGKEQVREQPSRRWTDGTAMWVY